MSERLVISLVIVGNEVLSGKVVEENATFLIGRMKSLGARVREVAFVEDDIDAISEAMARVRGRSHQVIVTGGVGPTHDDVTVLAAAKALGVDVVEEVGLVEQVARLSEAGQIGRTPSAGARRLARVPCGAELVWGKTGVPWPVTRADNLWLFPGVPPLMRALFEGVVEHFTGSPPIYSEELELLADEATICEALDTIVSAHPTVEIGSYPRRESGRWKLRLTFESHDRAAMKAAFSAACEAFRAYAPS